MMIPIKRKRLFRANPISRNWHFRTRRHRAVRREEGRQVLRDQNSVDYRCHQEEANRACQKWKKHSATNHSSVRHKHVSWNHFAYIVLVAIPIAHRTLSHITVLVITSIAKHSFLLHPNVLAASRKKVLCLRKNYFAVVKLFLNNFSLLPVEGSSVPLRVYLLFEWIFRSIIYGFFAFLFMIFGSGFTQTLLVFQFSIFLWK